VEAQRGVRARGDSQNRLRCPILRLRHVLPLHPFGALFLSVLANVAGPGRSHGISNMDGLMSCLSDSKCRLIIWVIYSYLVFVLGRISAIWHTALELRVRAHKYGVMFSL
jgi:hypothetical protein